MDRQHRGMDWNTLSKAEKEAQDNYQFASPHVEDDRKMRHIVK